MEFHFGKIDAILEVWNTGNVTEALKMIDRPTDITVARDIIDTIKD
jgi:hypothetical protein